MEELTNFDDVIAEFLNKKIEYFAEFNPETGRVFRLGPTDAFTEKNKAVIQVDADIAEQILSGIIPLSRCFVDSLNGKLELMETKNIGKIDDVLHRIVEKLWTDIDKPDVYIVCENNSIKIELSEELGGTYKLPQQYQPVKTRKIFWEGDTSMRFMITDYNDPHIIYKELNLKLQDLFNGPVIFENVNFTKNNSLYTRRLFQNYIMEFK